MNNKATMVSSSTSSRKRKAPPPEVHTDPALELEHKREISRQSSARLRHREKERFENLQNQQVELSSDNKRLRKDNALMEAKLEQCQQIVRLKESTAGSASTTSTAVSRAQIPSAISNHLMRAITSTVGQACAPARASASRAGNKKPAAVASLPSQPHIVASPFSLHAQAQAVTQAQSLPQAQGLPSGVLNLSLTAEERFKVLLAHRQAQTQAANKKKQDLQDLQALNAERIQLLASSFHRPTTSTVSGANEENVNMAFQLRQAALRSAMAADRNLHATSASATANAERQARLLGLLKPPPKPSSSSLYKQG